MLAEPGEEQVDGVRLVALSRRLGMPLADIADIAAKPPAEAARGRLSA
jgi:hypothetical protein